METRAAQVECVRQFVFGLLLQNLFRRERVRAPQTAKPRAAPLFRSGLGVRHTSAAHPGPWRRPRRPRRSSTVRAAQPGRRSSCSSPRKPPCGSS
eukprot:4046535-Prymnesium_polylepis.1